MTLTEFQSLASFIQVVQKRYLLSQRVMAPAEKVEIWGSKEYFQNNANRFEILE